MRYGELEFLEINAILMYCSDCGGKQQWFSQATLLVLSIEGSRERTWILAF